MGERKRGAERGGKGLTSSLKAHFRAARGAISSAPYV